MAGFTITTQAGINTQLKIAVNNQWIAAFISFLVGTIILGTYILITRQATPSIGQLQQIEVYKYAGGLLGAFFVTVIIFSVQRLGSANTFALVIAGQLLMALLYDHLGLFGFKQSPINWAKVLGVLMLIGGAWLVNRKA
jgi:transporter family-2 protein